MLANNGQENKSTQKQVRRGEDGYFHSLIRIVNYSNFMLIVKLNCNPNQEMMVSRINERKKRKI